MFPEQTRMFMVNRVTKEPKSLRGLGCLSDGNKPNIPTGTVAPKANEARQDEQQEVLTF